MTDTPPPAPHAADAAPPPSRAQRPAVWRIFWLGFLVVSLGYAWHSFYVPADDIDWAPDLATAQQQAAASGRSVALFFTATWCVPCRIMKRTVWADDEVADAVHAGFVPVAIDVDDPAAAEVLARYPIAGTPTTILTTADGQVLQHRAGGLDKAAFLDLLGTAAPGAAPSPR